MQERNAVPPARQPSSEASASLARRLAHLSETRGTDAIPELRHELSHPDPWVRMHVIEGLASIDHLDARAALAAALHDESFGVHMEAARTLAARGRPGVEAVLQELVRGTPTTSSLHGAAYVLRHARLSPVERSIVAPVAEALRRPVADLEAPIAAFPALAGLAPELVTETGAPEPWYRGLNRRRGPHGRTFAPISRDDTTP
ncbi:MAG: HEAT repeat domain-containing protein [Dehalococcoidia bacterium]